MFPPDGLLTLDDYNSDVNWHIIDPDPIESDDCLDEFPPAHLSLLTNAENLDTMSAGGDDEPPSGLNGRLRPRKSNVIKPDIPKASRKYATISADKPKKTSTPSKASPNKQDNLVEQSDSSLSTQFLCALCDKKFASSQNVLKHALRMHLSDLKQDTFITCLFCNYSEPHADDIICHMVEKHPNQYCACLDCHSRFSSTSALSEHKLTACEKSKVFCRNKLRQKIPGNKKKKTQNDNKREIPGDNKEFQEEHGLNGIVISCELKPSQARNEDDIEDNITTNLILPPSKTLPNAPLDKNAVILFDDIQWNKRVPSNFSFHNTDTDQILSRLGVVHRSPRHAEPTKREWLKLIDSTQKFERCFDTGFYTRVASNVQENLAKCLDGKCKFKPDPENIINTRKSKNSVAINTAEGFPILLASEQYSRNVLEGYLPRGIAPKHKWKWDNNDADRIQLNPDQIKRDNHTNKCIITLISSLDIWSQLRMRRKYEEIYNRQPVEEKTEKQNVIGRELKEILESREIPTSSQLVKYKHNPPVRSDGLEFPSSLGLAPVVPNHDVKPAVLSGEWVRPRCYVCCACGAQTRDPRGLSSHMATDHPNAKVQHYEIVGDSLLNSDILEHLYVPPTQVANRTRPSRGIRDCTKCIKPIALEELHQHMLDCAGDTPAVRRRQCRYRPFGMRKRRPRLPDNTVRQKIRSDIRHRQRSQKSHMRPRPRIRTEVGDAETIRKMLADLPAKRQRVLVNPSNQMNRPRRKLEGQRNKIMMKKAKSLDSKTRDMTANKDSTGNNESSTNDETGENSSDDDNTKVSRPLRTQASRVRAIRTTGQSQVLKRNAAINQAKKRFLPLNDQNSTSELIEKPGVQPNTNKINTETLSGNDQPKRIDVRGGSYNTREHASGGGSNNREQQRPGNNESNANNNNAQPQPPPPQNVPLKHSIALLTAKPERHDKAVQFNQVFLVQQECNNSGHLNMPSEQHMLFENEPAETKLDKPPLDSHQKGTTEHSNQKNNKQKPRKGLNACIAMLKNKLTDPVPCASVKCGNDDRLDMNTPLILPLPNFTLYIGTELKQNELTPKTPEENVSSVILPIQPLGQKCEPALSEAVQANLDIAPKIQLPKEATKRKAYRSRSFTHQDLCIAENIPIQLNPEVDIIPRKTSNCHKFLLPPPVLHKLRSRRDSVPQPSPRTENQPNTVLPEIDFYWKKSLEIKPHKMSSLKPSKIARSLGNKSLLMTSVSPKPFEMVSRSTNNNELIISVSPKPSEMASRSGNMNLLTNYVSPKPSEIQSHSGNNNVLTTSISPNLSEIASCSGNNYPLTTSVSPKTSEVLSRSGNNNLLMTSVSPKPSEVESRPGNNNPLMTSVSPKTSEVLSRSGNNNLLMTSVSPKPSEIASRPGNNNPLMTSVSSKPSEVPSMTSVSPKLSEIASRSGNNYPLMATVTPKTSEIASRPGNSNLLMTSVSPKPGETASRSRNNNPLKTSVSPKPSEVLRRFGNNLSMTSDNPKLSEIAIKSGNNYPLITAVTPKPPEVLSHSGNNNVLMTSDSRPGNNYPLVTSVSPKPPEVLSRSRNDNLLMTSVSPKASEVLSRSGNNNLLMTPVSPKRSEIASRSGNNYPLMTSVSSKTSEDLSRSGNNNLLITSVSQKPSEIESSGIRNRLMTSVSPRLPEILSRSVINSLWASSQMINPDMLAYEPRAKLRPGNENYSNLTLDYCALDMPLGHSDMYKERSIPAPLDLSAKIRNQSPYLPGNYDHYRTLDQPNNREPVQSTATMANIDTIPSRIGVDFREKQPPSPPPIQYSIGEDINHSTFVDVPPRINENYQFFQEFSSNRYNREEPLELFIRENTDNRSLRREKSRRKTPATECSIITAKNDTMSDKFGAPNYGTHYEHINKLRAASIGEKRSTRNRTYTNVLLQNERDYQLRAANEKTYPYNQTVNRDPVRYRADYRNKPATATSATYEDAILATQAMNNNINDNPSHVIPYGSHFTQSVHSETLCTLSSQFMGSQPALPKPPNLDHPVPLAEDTLRAISRVTDNSRTKRDIQPVVDLISSTSLDLNSTVRKESALNNDIHTSKKKKSKKITPDNINRIDTNCTTPQEILHVQPESVDKTQTHLIQPISPKSVTPRRRLSEYDNTSRDSSTPISDLNTKAKTTNQPSVIPTSLSMTSTLSNMTSESFSPILSNAEVTNIMIPSNEDSFNVSNLTSNETPLDNQNLIDINETQIVDVNNYQEQDQETAKKISMLPKELVDILGNMPAAHRNQLLNILPQYVSATPASRNNDDIEENNAVQHLTSNTQHLEQTHDVQILTQPPDSHLTNQEMTGQITLDNKIPTSNSMPQHTSPVLNNSNDEIKPLEEYLEPRETPDDEDIGKDLEPCVEVIDLTKSVGSENDAIKNSEDIPSAASSPNPDIISNLVTVGKPSKAKKSKDQTASLRAVRIKTPSQRHNNQMANATITDKVTQPNVVSENNSDNNEVNKSLNKNTLDLIKLAIQQSEICSTEDNNKKIVIDSLSPLIVSPPNESESSEENMCKNSPPLTIDPVNIVQNDTSMIAIQCSPRDITESKTCVVSKESNLKEKATEIDVNDKTIVHEVEVLCPIREKASLDENKVVSLQSDQDDDSEDDISLAAIVLQKQRGDLKKKFDGDAEIVAQEPPRTSMTRKRKKEKKPKKSNKNMVLEKVVDITKETKIHIAKQQNYTVTKSDEVDKDPTQIIKLDAGSASKITDNHPNKKVKKQIEGLPIQTILESQPKSIENETDMVLKKKFTTTTEQLSQIKNDKYSVTHHNFEDNSEGNYDVSNKTATMNENVEISYIQKEKPTVDINYDHKNEKNTKKKKRSEKLHEAIGISEKVITSEVKDDLGQDTVADTIERLEKEVPSTFIKVNDQDIKRIRLSTDISQDSDTTDHVISCHISDNSSSTPLRRSKRGKSLFMENEPTEYEILTNSERSSNNKGITKKQLIFSELLLDEDIQSKSQNFTSDYVIPNLDQDIEHHTEQEKTDNEEKSNDVLVKKIKPTKRKISPPLKRKTKKKKPLEMSEIEVVSESTHEDSGLSCSESNKTKTPLESKDIMTSQKSSSEMETITSDQKCKPEVDLHYIPKEKRKMCNVTSTSDNGHCPKAKKSKVISEEVVKSDNEDVKDKCDDIATDITPTTSLGIRSTCYNMPVAAKRTRSESFVVKGSPEKMQYDPYDIDLDDMDFKNEPFRQKITKSKNDTLEITKSPVENTTLESEEINTTEMSEERVVLTIIKESCKMKTDPIIEQNSQTAVNEKELESKPNKLKKTSKKAKSAGDNQRKLMKNKLKGSIWSARKNKTEINDSDDSSKSDIPLKKYVQKKRKIRTEMTLIVEKVRFDTDHSGPNLCERNQQNNCSDLNDTTNDPSTSHAEEKEMINDKFMENFGFFSERKPRKSNLLATKKISETFHIIANESDEEKSRKRSTSTEPRKSSEGVECYGFHICVKKTGKGCKMRSRSAYDDDDDKWLCGLCRKEFCRTDNYFRHQLTLIHLTSIGEVEIKIRTTAMIEEPSYLIVYKQQIDRLKMLIKKIAKRKKSKVKLPTTVEILEIVRETVRTQQLKQRSLSKDQALFIDVCELLQEAPKQDRAKIETVQIGDVNNAACASSLAPDIAVEKCDSNYDGDVDPVTARKILESEEVRNLENDLISGLKEVAMAKQAEYRQTEALAVDSNGECIVKFSSPNEDTQFDQTEESYVSEEIASTSKKQPVYKEKMYPDLDNIDIFEDKFDKIKRKCRSQAAAAKHTQSVAALGSNFKSRKKSDKKKIKKLKKNYQSTVLTKGALKGFDGIKVSIPTTDINIAAIVPQVDMSSKKKKKTNSKKKREKKDSEKISERPKEIAQKKLDVYEFMDNEEAELFEFRPSTLMERFKSISSKETKTRENVKLSAVPENIDTVSENASDGDDFVYMSDDYTACSDDETESSLMSEVGNKIDAKKSATLKKKDSVEKNAVMGKIFKHNAVRAEKKPTKTNESVEPKANLDQLFDSLLEDEPSSSMLHDDTLLKKDDFGYSSTKKLASPQKDASLQECDDSLLKRSPTFSPPPYDSSTPSSSGIKRYRKTETNKFEDDYVIDFGPSTSKRADEFYASMAKKMFSADSKNKNSNELSDLPSVSGNYKTASMKNKSLKEKSPPREQEESFDFNADFDEFNADDTGVARQRARRKCTVGKQNVLAETWSSESELDGAPHRPKSTESVVANSARKKKGKKKDGQHSARRSSKNIGKKQDFDSRVNNGNRNGTGNCGDSRRGGGEDCDEAVDRVESSGVLLPEALAGGLASSGGAGAAGKARPRPAAYYWSSEGDEEPEHVQQHGWIVGDSHKKLVTMLAHAKGRKRDNDEHRHLVE